MQNQQLKDAANSTASYAGDAAAQTAALALKLGNPTPDATNELGLAQQLGALAAQCGLTGESPTFCQQLGGIAADLGTAAADAGTAATSAGYASGYATPTASGIADLMTQTSAGLTDAADGARGLASGLDQLQSGTTQSADGARQLATGASQLGDGGDQLATGAQSLADGVAQLASGTDQLATGLQTATDQIPTYTDTEAASLADVVSNPVAAEGNSTSLFGESAIPLLATAALWFGGLATFVAMQAVSRRALSSRAPSAAIAFRAFGPAAAIGALQGLLVASVVQLAASYDWTEWSLFAGLCIGAGVAFAAVNQALVAVFGGAGRWIAALIGAFLIATGVVSTVPPALAAISTVMPTTPAYNGMVGALTAAGRSRRGARGPRDLGRPRVRRDRARRDPATHDLGADAAGGIPRHRLTGFIEANGVGCSRGRPRFASAPRRDPAPRPARLPAPRSARRVARTPERGILFASTAALWATVRTVDVERGGAAPMGGRARADVDSERRAVSAGPNPGAPGISSGRCRRAVP